MSEILTATGRLWASIGPPGTGQPTLIWIHGAGGTRLDWPAPLRQLPGVNGIVYDLAGHGRSAGPARDTVAEHAADLVALLDALSLPDAVLAGHSLGGAIALQTAVLAPTRVRGLVLISTAARIPVNPSLLEATADPPALAAMTRRWFWGEDVPEAWKDVGEARIASVPADVLRADFGAAETYDVRAALSSITAPALIMCGTADRGTPPSLSEALRDGLPNAEAMFFEGAGHRLPEERALEVAAAIAGWLPRVTPDRPDSSRTAHLHP